MARLKGDFQIFNFCNDREGGQSVVIVRYDFSEIQLEEGLVYQNSPPVTQQTSSVNTAKIRNPGLVSCETQRLSTTRELFLQVYSGKTD